VSPGAGAQEFGRQLSNVELDTLRERVEKVLKEAETKVVVLIDDIDRLDRNEIQAMFKLVKLSAGFRETSYVLAFDDEIVSDALAEKYGSGSKEAGRSFLEKIIQVPLNLPPADELSLRKMTFEGVDSALKLSGIELTEDQAQAFGRHFVDGLELRLRTPRQAKRYANVLTFALPILKSEVHPVDHLLIEGMRVFYPKLYLAVRENPDICLGRRLTDRTNPSEKERILKQIDAGFSGLTISEQEAAKDLLKVLFPRLTSLFGNMSYGRDWDERWEREKRICSDQYFQRFFSYAIPLGDLSDQALDSFLDMIPNSDQPTIGELIKEFVSRGQSARLIHKLRRREDTFNPAVAEKLAIVLAKNAKSLPVEKGAWSAILSTAAQASILIYKLIRRIQSGADRERVARDIIKHAEPLPFAFECLRWLRKDKEKPGSEETVSEELERELGEILVNRVKDASNTEPPYISFPDNGAPALFWIWNEYGSKGEVGNYLTDRFGNNAAETPKFLASYVGTAWGMESGLSHKGDLRRDSYDAIVK
jgi:hypothetical protein